ncbi:MAG: response regulator [Desulfobacterales bacterium]|nr:response regulator [Desulfobacterales bacterium]
MPKVLIIDDEASIRIMLSTLLEKNGYSIVTAENGAQGFNLFKTHLPDLTITDLIMPEKEGLELIREIKTLDPEAKIIAMSGGGTAQPDTYLKLAARFGAQRTFSKPINTERLLSFVQEALAQGNRI